MKSQQTEYEIVLLLTPTFSEQQAKDFIEEWKQTALKDCKVTFEDFWGKKTLAYSIKKEESAYYVVICFTGEGHVIAPLDEEIRLESKYCAI
jgi:small subunit ribosomal protein S6